MFCHSAIQISILALSQEMYIGSPYAYYPSCIILHVAEEPHAIQKTVCDSTCMHLELGLIDGSIILVHSLMLS